MMQPITTLTSRTVVLEQADIDTDQIIPARFLTTTERTGLGQHAFWAWRWLADGKPDPDFPLNSPDAAGAQILVAGNNFGCGSSREHAPWALYDLGFRAVISTQIADIFRSNAQKNGIVPVIIDAATHAWLLANPNVHVTVDVAACELGLPDGRRVPFSLDPFARHCLINGVDQLGYLLNHLSAITAFEKNR